MDFFAKEDTQALLRLILFIWTKEHESLGYVQGMNEILAPLIYVRHQDTWAHSEMYVFNPALVQAALTLALVYNTADYGHYWE